MAVGRLLARLRGTTSSAVMARSAAGSFIVLVAGTGALFLLHIVLGRTLGQMGYGDFAVAMAWTQILILPCKVGFDTAALRYVAAYRGQQQWGFLRGFLRGGYLIVGGVSILVACCALSAIGLAGERLRPELRTVLAAAWLLLPVAALNDLSGANLRGLKHAILSQLPNTILRPLVLLAGVGTMALVWGNNLTAAKVMLVNIGAFAVSLLVTLAILKSRLPADVSSAPIRLAMREWIVVALPLFLYSGMHLILGQTDTVMVGAIHGTAEAGVYDLACRISRFVGFGLLAVNMIAAPLIAELYTQRKHRELQRMVSLAALGVLAFTLPVAVGLALIGWPLLKFVGPGFTSGYVSLVLLCGGQLVHGLVGSVGLLMTMTGHQQKALYIMIFAAVANVVLNLLLIPPLGIEGAAIATITTKVLWNVLMYVYVKNQLGIDSTAFVLLARRG